MKVNRDTNAALLSELGATKQKDSVRKDKASEKSARNTAAGSYNVKLSPENSTSRRISEGKATAIAKATDPIRADKIEALKASIANGTYKIDSGKIADGMLKEAIKDEIAKDPSQVYLGG